MKYWKKTITIVSLSLLVWGCSARKTCEAGLATPPESVVRKIVILYTNDEHGWMEASDSNGGAPGMMGLWREQEGYTEDGPFLILSGGDMWTGPVISTWFEGESMVEVMNAMGYDAAAIGNHEFDFGLNELRDRIAQAEFPFLSANIREKKTGKTPEAVFPYIIEEVNGVKIGLIGLSSIDTPQLTNPTTVAEFNFISYQEALSKVASTAKSEGAEMLIVIAHACFSEIRSLAGMAAKSGVVLIGGGHCHEVLSSKLNGITIIESGSFMDGYVRVDIAFDTVTDTVIEINTQLRENRDGIPNQEVEAVIATWRDRLDDRLDRVIGYVEQPILLNSDAMFNLVTDAWLKAYPTADVALNNRGGFRQDIPAGEIRLSTIFGVLPFNNVLVDVELNGAALIEEIKRGQPVVAGMTTLGGYTLTDGTPIDLSGTYHVLINDFMYAGGDGYTFQIQDPDAYNTSIDWRQPVIEWISELNSTPEDPLDNSLDITPRQ